MSITTGATHLVPFCCMKPEILAPQYGQVALETLLNQSTANATDAIIKKAMNRTDDCIKTTNSQNPASNINGPVTIAAKSLLTDL
jgi:hypothetical protein